VVVIQGQTGWIDHGARMLVFVFGGFSFILISEGAVSPPVRSAGPSTEYWSVGLRTAGSGAQRGGEEKDNQIQKKIKASADEA